MKQSNFLKSSVVDVKHRFWSHSSLSCNKTRHIKQTNSPFFCSELHGFLILAVLTLALGLPLTTFADTSNYNAGLKIELIFSNGLDPNLADEDNPNGQNFICASFGNFFGNCASRAYSGGVNPDGSSRQCSDILTDTVNSEAKTACEAAKLWEKSISDNVTVKTELYVVKSDFIKANLGIALGLVNFCEIKEPLVNPVVEESINKLRKMLINKNKREGNPTPILNYLPNGKQLLSNAIVDPQRNGLGNDPLPQRVAITTSQAKAFGDYESCLAEDRIIRDIVITDDTADGTIILFENFEPNIATSETWTLDASELPNNGAISAAQFNSLNWANLPPSIPPYQPELRDLKGTIVHELAHNLGFQNASVDTNRLGVSGILPLDFFRLCEMNDDICTVSVNDIKTKKQFRTAPRYYLDTGTTCGDPRLKDGGLDNPQNFPALAVFAYQFTDKNQDISDSSIQVDYYEAAGGQGFNSLFNVFGDGNEASHFRKSQQFVNQRGCMDDINDTFNQRLLYLEPAFSIFANQENVRPLMEPVSLPFIRRDKITEKDLNMLDLIGWDINRGNDSSDCSDSSDSNGKHKKHCKHHKHEHGHHHNRGEKHKRW